MKNIKIYLFLILNFNFLLLISYISNISISADEARILFFQDGYLHYILQFFTLTFGQNDFAIRIPFIILHLVNTTFLLILSKKIVKKKEDLILVALIYMLLPGINLSALMVSKIQILIFFTLLFLILYDRFKQKSYFLLPLMALVDNTFIHLFIALSFYGHYKKDTNLLIIATLCIIISYGIFGYDFGQVPQGYFLDIFGVYGAIFSPLFFIFYIYSIYWFVAKYPLRLPIIWFIASNTFIISVILSLRQFVFVEDFAPFVIVFVPYSVYVFLNSYRIRLPEFRKKYKVIFGIMLSVMFFNTVATFYNRPFYLFYNKPRQHFAFQYHFAKEIACFLKKHHIDGVVTDKNLQLRLKFYGIKKNENYTLTQKRVGDFDFKIPFKVFGKEILAYYVVKTRS